MFFFFSSASTADSGFHDSRFVGLGFGGQRRLGHFPQGNCSVGDISSGKIL
jgi:hypothetical protein